MSLSPSKVCSRSRIPAPLARHRSSPLRPIMPKYVVIAVGVLVIMQPAARAERLPPVRATIFELSIRALEEQQESFADEPTQPETLEQPSRDMRLQTLPDGSPNEPSGITLEELERIALTNNPTLTKAAASVEAGRGTWMQSGLYPNPNLAYLGNEIGDQSTAGKQGGYIEQEFVRGGKLPLNRAIAARDIEIAQRDFAAQKLRLLNDVRIHFYAALVAQHQLDITRDLVDVGDRALQAAEDLLEAKEVSRIDVLQARVEVNEAQLALANSQNRFQAEWRSIAALIGVPGMVETRLQGDVLGNMPKFSWEESIGRILVESPELAATRLGVERAVCSLRRARVEPIPNVTIQAGPQYDLAAHRTLTNAVLVLPTPLFNRNQGNIRRAEADLRAARAEVARRELELTARLASAFERYLNARNQSQQYRGKIMPNAREALELVTSGYRQGELSYLALLTTQRTYVRTNLAYLDALRELWETSITIDGLLLTDSLQANRETVIARPPTAATPLPMSPLIGR